MEKIKKELTQIEFEKILIEFQDIYGNEKTIYDIGKDVVDIVKKIIPAKEVHFLLITDSEKVLETITLSNNIKIDIASSLSMMLQCYESKEAFFSNDIERDIYYKSEIDNFLDYPLKNLLLSPLLTENNQCLGIIWAAIPKKDLNQYMQSDLTYIRQISILDENILAREKKEQKRDREVRDNESTSSVVKRLKSWLFK